MCVKLGRAREKLSPTPEGQCKIGGLGRSCHPPQENTNMDVCRIVEVHRLSPTSEGHCRIGELGRSCHPLQEGTNMDVCRIVGEG